MLSYFVYFLTVAAILSIATQGLNLQWGVSGQFNAGVVGFVAVGGYSLAVLTMPPSDQLLVNTHLPFALGLIGAVLISGVVALVVGLLTLRLRSDYLAIATFGIATSIQVLVNNWEPLTGGSRGLVGIPRPFVGLGREGFGWAWLLMVAGFVAVIGIGLKRLLDAPWGRVQRGLRDDEVACAALGKPVVRHRLVVFVLGAMLMGLCGALYVAFIGSTSPTEFLPILTFQIWAMLIVGGSGSLSGAVVGSLVVWGLWTLSGAVIVSLLPPQWQAQGGSLQSILVGVVLVLMLLYRPRGLLGRGS